MDVNVLERAALEPRVAPDRGVDARSIEAALCVELDRPPSTERRVLDPIAIKPAALELAADRAKIPEGAAGKVFVRKMGVAEQQVVARLTRVCPADNARAHVDLRRVPHSRAQPSHGNE
jgi:hypothetical protein